MCAITDRLGNERGVGIVAVLLLILALALMATVATDLVVREMDSGRSHLQSEQALYVAHAGLEYGRRQLEVDRNWVGVAPPGIAVGDGAFTVWTSPYDADGTTLPAGMVAVRSRGTVGNVRRELTMHANESGASYTLWATAAGNAQSISATNRYPDLDHIRDGAPNGSYGHGAWTPGHRGLFTGFTGSLPPSGTVSRVEALVHGYLNQPLSNDYLNVRTYWNNGRVGRVRSISRAALNTRVGSSNVGLWTADISANRTWTVADFSGDVELLVRDIRTKTDDGATIYIDAVGLRVTLSTGGPLTFHEYREVNS